jgi:hypothetical protein
MKSLFKTALLALVAICLLASPAISHQWHRGYSGIYNNGWLLLPDDINEQMLDDMTLAEINALRQQQIQKIRNMTLSEVQDLREQKWQEMDNMTLAELQEKNRVMGYFESLGLAFGPQHGYGHERFERLQGATWMLLVDDATKDQMDNMTRVEVRALKQQKIQKLENMTLSEIRVLREQKAQEFENMTLSELKQQSHHMSRCCRHFRGH